MESEERELEYLEEMCYVARQYEDTSIEQRKKIQKLGKRLIDLMETSQKNDDYLVQIESVAARLHEAVGSLDSRARKAALDAEKIHIASHAEPSVPLSTIRKQITEDTRLVMEIKRSLDNLHGDFSTFPVGISVEKSPTLQLVENLVENRRDTSLSAILTSVDTTPQAQDSRNRYLDMAETDNVLNTVRHILSSKQATVTSILVCGPSGSGKSYTCDHIEQECRTRDVKVLKPNLPLDVLGKLVGEKEQRVLSAVDPRKVDASVVIIDSLEDLLGTNFGSNSHLRDRCRLIVVDIIDQSRELSDTNILFVFTANSLGSGSDLLAGRIDYSFDLRTPEESRRLAFIRDILVDRDLEDDVSLLEAVVESLDGKTFGEIEDYCQRAFQQSMYDSRPGLQLLGEAIVSSDIHSLKARSARNSTDFRVLSQLELAADNNEVVLLGQSYDLAFERLFEALVLPICYSDRLAYLMNGESVVDNEIRNHGVLLSGPSGTGKTALALRVAREATERLPSLKTIVVNCTSLISKEVGASERAIKKLFESIRESVPCIAILESVESIASVRGNDNTTEGTMDRVLSTLLIELDGVDRAIGKGQKTKGFGVIGITQNEAWIDPALRRPGRLDQSITLPLPNESDRLLILKSQFQSMEIPSFSSVSLDFIAQNTGGFSGASIVALCQDLLIVSEGASTFPQEELTKLIARRH